MAKESAATEATDFDWSQCASGDCVGARVDGEEHCLRHVPLKRQDAELKRLRRGRPLDVRGVEIDEALWARLLDAVPRDAMGRCRFSKALFDYAVFRCDVELDEATFARDAVFKGARFDGAVSMYGLRVHGQTSFAKAAFAGPVQFDGARFGGPTWFSNATFARDVSFEGADFGGQLLFVDVDLAADIVLKHAVLARHSSFDGTRFGCHADLAAITCEADVTFEGATFANAPTVDGAIFKGRHGVPTVAAKRPVKWWGSPLALWGERAKAALLDAAVPVSLVASGFVVAPILHAIEHNEAAIGVIVVGLVAGVGFRLHELIEQGHGGQTRGKRRVGIRLVSERHRRPVGPALSVVRDLVHILDTLPLLAGWFRPLRDEKRQTFADKIMGTVVVEVGENFARTNAEGAPARLATAGFG